MNTTIWSAGQITNDHESVQSYQYMYVLCRWITFSNMWYGKASDFFGVKNFEISGENRAFYVKPDKSQRSRPRYWVATSRRSQCVEAFGIQSLDATYLYRSLQQMQELRAINIILSGDFNSNAVEPLAECTQSSLASDAIQHYRMCYNN